MRILWVTAKRIAIDLASTTQLSVSKELSDRGWEVTIVAPEGNDSEAAVISEGHSFIGVKRSKITGLGWMTFGSSLKRIIPKLVKNNQFDVALIEWQAVSGSISSLKKIGIPWLLVDRSPPVFRSIAGRLQWFEYQRAWRLARKSGGASGSVLKSQALIDWHREKENLVEPVILMEAGVDVGKYSVANFSGPCTIVHHGQLDEEREIERIVRIGEVLSARGFEFKMKIAGTGNRLTTLQKSALLHDWLEVLGPLPSTEIPKFLADGHVALFPLPDGEIWRLASPLKIREWAAAGLPMILSDITPHRSVGDRKWIRLVAPESPLDKWADCIEDILKEDLAKLGKIARSDSESEFDWKFTTEELHTKMLQLIGG